MTIELAGSRQCNAREQQAPSKLGCVSGSKQMRLPVLAVSD